jgi:hypothetical protein
MFVDSNGDIALVRGVDAIFQNISMALSTKKGDIYFYPEYGSIIREYFKKYKNNLGLLSRLFKLELSRLYFVNFYENSSTHIKYFNDVKIQSNILVNQFINVEISIVLESDEQKTKIVPVFIGL